MAASWKTVNAGLAQKGLRRDFVISAVAVATICVFASGFSTIGTKSYDSGSIGIGDVKKAFTTVGIKLTIQPEANGVRIFNNLLNPVPNTKYNVQVDLYKSTSAAVNDYAKFSSKWRYSGFAAMRKQNVIVLAWPWGHNIGMKGSPFAMPKLVSKAISLLP